jgi:hypothetical protein
LSFYRKESKKIEWIAGKATIKQKQPENKLSGCFYIEQD